MRENGTDALKLWGAAFLCICAQLLLAACQSPAGAQTVVATPAEPSFLWQAPQPLIVAVNAGMPMLDIGVVLFDPGVDEDDDSPAAAVRRLETSLLANALKTALTESNQFGVVRLVPEASSLTPVSLHSEILRSDGRDLVLKITARDSLSQVWFDTTVAHREPFSASGVTALREIFHAVSNQLLSSWRQIPMEKQAKLIAASEVMYAQTLLPNAFSGMLKVSEKGWRLERLPASNDPMMARITRVRNQEYLFCDAIDEQYGDLAERVTPTYLLWRQATVEQAVWLERYQQRVVTRDHKSDDSRFARMQAQYAAYRSYRIQEQALFELAEAFENETRRRCYALQNRL